MTSGMVFGRYTQQLVNIPGLISVGRKAGEGVGSFLGFSAFLKGRDWRRKEKSIPGKERTENDVPPSPYEAHTCHQGQARKQPHNPHASPRGGYCLLTNGTHPMKARMLWGIEFHTRI